MSPRRYLDNCSLRILAKTRAHPSEVYWYTIIMRSIFAILTLNFIQSLLLSVFLIVCCVGLYLWKNSDYYKKLGKFNSLPTVPLLGNMLPFLLNRKGREETMLELLAQYEAWKPFVYWISYLPIVVVTKYEDILTVSNKSTWRNARGKFRKVFGDSIALAHPDKWRNIRRAVNPAFYPTMLQQYLIVFNKHSEDMVRKMNDVCNTGKLIDIYHFMENNSLMTVTENMAGVDLRFQLKTRDEFAHCLKALEKLEISRYFEFWKYPEFLYNLYLLLSGKEDLYKRVHKMPAEVIRTKISEYRSLKEKQKMSNGNLIADRPVKTYVDILVELYDTHPEFTEQQVHDELITMMTTGSESTAVLSSFTLLLLAIYQDAQEKVYEEIVNAFGSDPSRFEVKMEDLMGTKFEYLDRCIKETLRKYTLVPLMARETTEEVPLSDGNVIPTGTIVVMIYYILHRDPSVFPDPEKWDPEHFADERVKTYFLPFGTGPKLCIGYKYAMLSAKTQIIHVLRRYHLSTNIELDDIEMEYGLSIRKKDGYPVTVTLRENDSYKYAMNSLKTQIIHVLRRYHLSTNIGVDDIELDYCLTLRMKGGYPVTVTLRENDKK